MSQSIQQPAMSDETDAAQPENSEPSQPVVEFREIYNKQALTEFHHDALYEVLPSYIDDLSYFLLAMVDKVRPMLHASLASKKGIKFLVSVQVEYSHANKELIDMTPK